MPNEEKDGLGLPPIGGIVIVIISIGAIWFNLPHLKSSRPGENGSPTQVVDLEDVSARLWQDPFGPTYKHEGHKSQQDSIHSHYALTKMIAGEDKKRGGPEAIHIIGVMVEGGNYFENVEQKRRRRYAVVSALTASGYMPENAQRIGYILGAGHKVSNGYNVDLPEKIPYELFKYNKKGESPKEKPLIVLLWLDEEFFGSDFLTKINALTEVLHLNGSNSTQKEQEQAKFTILGPASSTTLKSMVRKLGMAEVNRDNIRKFIKSCMIINILGSAQTSNQILDISRFVSLNNHIKIIRGEYDRWHNLKNLKFTILSPTATVENELLVENVPSCEKDIGELFKDTFPKGRFFRTIKSDYALGECIYAELTLRGVQPGKDHIVLISEWDTDYGRWLPRSLERAFQNKSNGFTDEAVTKYSYIRGLDGHTSDDLADDQTSLLQLIKDSHITEKEDYTSRGNTNPSIGNSQFDYLERIGEKIQDRNSELRRKGKGQIKAIGVLGSDAYDKLLVLQALRKSFPGVIFFTTDLDARLSDRYETQWTKNLIVASNFGLQMHPGLQGDIPPFRDNYQTSVFFSTRLALETNYKVPLYYVMEPNIYGVKLGYIYNFIPKTVLYNSQLFRILLGLNMNFQYHIDSLIRPKIFEIGRHKPCELRQPNSSSDMNISIYPPSPKFLPDTKKIYLIFYSIILGAILLVTMVFKKKVQILLWILVFGYALIILLFYCSYNEYFDKGFWLEPFTWFEGISMWPAELLKCISIICSGWCLYYAYKKLKENREVLSEKYFFQDISEEESDKENKIIRVPSVIKVLMILLSSLACYLFLWHYIESIWGKYCNLIWIVTLAGLLIWSIFNYLMKLVIWCKCNVAHLFRVTLSRDQKKGRKDKEKSINSDASNQGKDSSSGVSANTSSGKNDNNDKIAKENNRTNTNHKVIATLIIISTIISTCFLYFWDFLENFLGSYFNLIWLIPIGLLGFLIVYYFDNFVISRKLTSDREDKNVAQYNAHTVWREYCKYGEVQNRYFRSTIIGVFFLLFSVFIIRLFGELHVPFRGDKSKNIDMIITYVSFLLFVVLLFYVVDAARLCVRFVTLIMGKHITWSGEIRSKFGIISGIDSVATDHWLKIKLIAERTEAVNKLSNYPIWVILSVFVSYITYFDNWFVPLSLYMLFGISLAIPILCSYLLHHEAMEAKDIALEDLNRQLIKETTKLFSGYQKRVIDQINLFISEVKGIRKGAFVPFFQQPFVRSIIYLLGIIVAVLSQYYSYGY